MSNINERFLSLKKILNLTKEQFCKEIGLSTTTYDNYSGGKGSPKSPFLVNVCEVFGISGDWLLTGKGPIYATPSNRIDKSEPQFGTALKAIFEDPTLKTTPQKFAAIGGVTVKELNSILEGQMAPPAAALRKWAINYRINMNFLIAQMGQPLLTAEQYEQDGPLMDMRVKTGEDKYPKGCGDPSKIDRKEKLEEAGPEMLTPGTTLPLIGLAQCGVTGWSLKMPLAAISSVPEFHKDIIAAMTIGDSMAPAGINPGNIVYCDPKMEPMKGEPVFVIRRGRDAQKEGEATVKLFMGEDEKWIYLKGWLPNMSTQQKEFEIKQLKDEIETIAPVVMIRRRS